MITKIILKNWKCHKNTEISFSKGTNVLLGMMGSGKSSIVDGITFALFGTTPSISTRKVKIDQLIMDRPQKEKDALVEVFFTMGGTSYSVKRIIERGSGTSYSEIRKENTMIESPKSESVTKQVEKVLQTDYETFVGCVYAIQNKLDLFLTLSPGERAKKIDELLQINRFELARKTLVSMTNLCNDREREKKKTLESFSLDFNEKNIITLKNDIELLKESVKKGIKTRDSSEKKLQNFEVKLKELETKKKKYKIFFDKINTLTGKKEHINESIHFYTSKKNPYFNLLEIDLNNKQLFLEKEKIQLNKDNKESKDLLIEKQHLSTKKNTLKESIKHIQISKKESEIENELNDFKSFLLDSNKKIETLLTNIKIENKEKSSFEGKIEYLNSLKKSIDNLTNEKTIISNFLDEKNIKYIEKNLTNIDEKMELIKSNIMKCQVEIRNEGDSINQLKESESLCPVCESNLNIEKKESLISKKNKNTELLTKQLSEFSKQLPVEKKLKEKLTLEKKQIDEKKHRLQVIEKDISFKDKEFSQYTKIKKSILTIERKIKELENEKEALIKKREESISQEKELSSLLEKSKEKKRVQEDIQNLSEKLSNVEQKLNTILKRFSQEKLEQNVNKLKLINEALDYVKLINQQKTIEQELKQCEDDITKLDFSEEEFSSNEKNVNKLREILIKTKTEIIHNKKRIIEQTKQYEELLEKKKTIKKQKKEINKLKSTSDNLKTFSHALSQVQIELRSQVIEQVNAQMNNLWQLIYPYNDIIDVSLVLETKKNKSGYTLLMKTSDNIWRDVDSVASGGERALAVLTLSLSFANVLTGNISWLILDEPTHNLDSNAISMLTTSLKEKIPQILNQVLIITHEETLENAITGECYRLHRDKTHDLPSQLERV